MPVKLDTDFLGLWLDEDMLREEFDAIIEAGWGDEPTDRRRDRPRSPQPRGAAPVPMRSHHGGRMRRPASLEFGEAPARERGPPGSR
jgi:hypothetical protein